MREDIVWIYDSIMSEGRVSKENALLLEQTLTRSVEGHYEVPWALPEMDIPESLRLALDESEYCMKHGTIYYFQH